VRHLGQRHLRHRAVVGDVLGLQPAEERAQRRHGTCQRSSGQAIAPARGHEAAEQPGIETSEIGKTGRVAKIVLQPTKKLAQIAAIGFERLAGRATLMCQVREPALGRATQIIAERQAVVGQDVVQGRCAHRHVPDSALRTLGAKRLTGC
jgi:hypothetical protein